MIHKPKPSDKKKKQKDILQGSLYRVILMLALPIMLNNLIGTLYNLGDALWVSRLGDIPVAAINFVWPVSFLTLSIATGMSIAGGAIISQFLGGEDEISAEKTVQQLYIFGVLFGIVSACIGWVATPYILRLMHASPALLDASIRYLKIMFLEMPFLFMMNIFFSVNQSQGDTVTPMLVNGSSAILNILLDPLFIFVFNLGIEGAAIATVLSKVPFALYGIYRMSRSDNALVLRPFSFTINGHAMRELIRIGIPSSLGNSGVALGFIVLFSTVATYGDIAVTAIGIGNRLNGLAFMPAVGFGAALSTIVGQNLGANQLDRVKEAFSKSIRVALVALIGTSAILWFFSENLVRLFSDTPEVVYHGSIYLRSLAMTTWSISFFNCSIGLFNGSGQTRISMFLEAGRIWAVRMPLILLLTQYFGVLGIWYAIGLSNVISAAIAFAITHLGTWKRTSLAR